MSTELGERIAQLEARLEDLESRLPKHSIPAAMVIELEDIEEELAQLRAQAGRVSGY